MARNEMAQVQATLDAARRAYRSSRIQLVICYTLLVVGILLGVRGMILGGVVFFIGVLGSRIASRDQRRHRLTIFELEQRLKQMTLPPSDDEADR